MIRAASILPTSCPEVSLVSEDFIEILLLVLVRAPVAELQQLPNVFEELRIRPAGMNSAKGPIGFSSPQAHRKDTSTLYRTANNTSNGGENADATRKVA